MMGELLTDLNFEEWIVHTFDRPVPEKKKWYVYDDGGDGVGADEAELEPATVLEYTTRLFRDCGSLLEPYSDAQLNQALWYLVSDGTSDLYCLADTSLPLDDSLACVASMTLVYEQCFLPRCTDHLGHCNETGGRLNPICYMWWDIFPLYGQPNDVHRREIDDACLKVMETALGLSSVACQESALHGLGHWIRSYPERCRQIVRSFIKDNQRARPDLLTYAEEASKGRVL
ncbi:MAG: hypothetical protein IIC73_02110 [Armatimonadetes bacterium]|nr:hypothetical protein [Armatimonadota bacterium]